MTGLPVAFLDVGATYTSLSDELDAAYRRVMSSGWFLLGPELEAFETDFAAYGGAAACAGVASGLDALVLALRVLDVAPGDEVIVPSNTYIATWLAVSAVGATVVPVEPDEDTCNLTGDGVAAAITSRTAAVLAVHLYGRPADVIGIDAVAGHHGIPVVYDGAQAHGASVDGRPVGEFGDLTAWSFYPGKNLGAFADGGAVTGRDARLIERIRRLRNYGSDVKYVNQERGTNSRLDELQAAVLAVKLRHLDEWNARRTSQAHRYGEALGGLDLRLPMVTPGVDSAWHLYVVRDTDRDGLQAKLAEHGIGTLIHYPIPPHRQEAYGDQSFCALPVAERMAGQVLSLPLGPHLHPEQHERVIAVLGQLLAGARLTARATIALLNWNGGDYVRPCVESVLRQTERKLEILVVDNHSGDGSADVMERLLETASLPYEVIRLDENRGICGGLQVALDRATGVYFFPFASDDEMLPDRVARQCDQLDLAGSSTDIAAGAIELIGPQGEPLRDWRRRQFTIRPPRYRGGGSSGDDDV